MAHKDRSSWLPPKNRRLSLPLARQILWISGLGLALVYSIRLAIGTDNFTGYIPLAVVLLFTLIRIGYRYEWTGFGETSHPKSEENEIQPRKTLWDWMDLLLVPSMIVLLGFGLTWYLNNSEQARQAEEAARAELMRTQAQTLLAYLDQMTFTMVEQDLHGSEKGDVVRTMAQARTSAALGAVGPDNRRTLLLFLYDSRLINRGSAIISLVDAELRDAELRGADLHGADLHGANLHGADLRDANLRGANLRGAEGVTNEQLQQAILDGATTMPNGQKYEEWLKSKDGGEDGGNSGPS